MTGGPSSASSAWDEPSRPGEHGRALSEILAARIRAEGPISFADFMRESLYHPAHGYYSRKNARRFGDYYTSVDVHPIFGRLLARQFAEMWQLLGSPRRFLVVESAAGNKPPVRRTGDRQHESCVTHEIVQQFAACRIEATLLHALARLIDIDEPLVMAGFLGGVGPEIHAVRVH